MTLRILRSKCPRCGGAVRELDTYQTCLICGCEPYDIPADVLAEYQNALGKSTTGKVTGSRAKYEV